MHDANIKDMGSKLKKQSKEVDSIEEHYTIVAESNAIIVAGCGGGFEL